MTVYPAGARQGDSRKIINGIVAPAALAVDSKGSVSYVINLHIRKPPFFGWVTVYAPGGTEPVRKITDGTTEPTALKLSTLPMIFMWPLRATQAQSEYTALGVRSCCVL